jgi:hypothetical protein
LDRRLGPRDLTSDAIRRFCFFFETGELLFAPLRPVLISKCSLTRRTTWRDHSAK